MFTVVHLLRCASEPPCLQSFVFFDARVNLHGLALVTSSSVRFSFASRSGSSNRSMAVNPVDQVVLKQNVSNPPNRLNAGRSAMTNSLVRIGTVEGEDLVKRTLAALIRPSSHQ
ncbi:hypothetical protein L1987_29351 [Smallanthus sonchifolius]|uniref:Uncharacterized protein n=1 Tax=Smallanthus sonchifolius TaxID=185202 RepID=A0ACB9HZM9_9ASTR|nr:hypothetical protein L1987_29351 [Smallanthus sonchifolius]